MKRFILYTLLTITTTCGFSQERLELAVIGSPTFSYRMVTGDQEFRELLKDIHNPKLSYETGVLITAKKTGQLDLQTGLVLSRKGLSFEELSIIGPDNDPVNGSLDISMTADFLEVPFRLNYYISEARRNYLIAGISADFLLKARYHYKFEGDIDNVSEEQPTGMRKVNTSIQIGYGLRLVDSEKFGLDLQPNFKLQLLDANTNTNTINMHFYSIGLACVFRLNF